MMCLLYYRKWLVGVHSSLCLPVGPVVGISVASLPVCLQRLKISIRDLHRVLEGRSWALINNLVVPSHILSQPCTTSTPPRLH